MMIQMFQRQAILPRFVAMSLVVCGIPQLLAAGPSNSSGSLAAAPAAKQEVVITAQEMEGEDFDSSKGDNLRMQALMDKIPFTCWPLLMEHYDRSQAFVSEIVGLQNQAIQFQKAPNDFDNAQCQSLINAVKQSDGQLKFFHEQAHLTNNDDCAGFIGNRFCYAYCKYFAMNEKCGITHENGPPVSCRCA